MNDQNCKTCNRCGVDWLCDLNYCKFTNKIIDINKSMDYKTDDMPICKYSNEGEPLSFYRKKEAK